MVTPASIRKQNEEKGVTNPTEGPGVLSRRAHSRMGRGTWCGNREMGSAGVCICTSGRGSRESPWPQACGAVGAGGGVLKVRPGRRKSDHWECVLKGGWDPSPSSFP